MSPAVTPPTHWLSIDPGEVHMAVAAWRGQECTKVTEGLPNDMMDMIDGEIALGRVDLITYERWVLDARHMGKFVGKDMLTSQCIGGIERTAYRNRIPVIGYRNYEHKRIYKQGWFIQLTLAEKRAMPWWHKNVVSRGHCMDAWCVGMWHKFIKGWSS